MDSKPKSVEHRGVFEQVLRGSNLHEYLALLTTVIANPGNSTPFRDLNMNVQVIIGTLSFRLLLIYLWSIRLTILATPQDSFAVYGVLNRLSISKSLRQQVGIFLP